MVYIYQLFVNGRITDEPERFGLGDPPAHDRRGRRRDEGERAGELRTKAATECTGERGLISSF
jgi:hypothetical protein